MALDVVISTAFIRMRDDCSLNERRTPDGLDVFEKGVQPFKVRARIMLILGEQLIRDEVAAVYELVKNAYDADATRVSVILDSVESASQGKIIVLDDGIGMTRKTLLDSFLEIGTLSKSYVIMGSYLITSNLI